MFVTDCIIVDDDCDADEQMCVSEYQHMSQCRAYSEVTGADARLTYVTHTTLEVTEMLSFLQNL